MKINSIKLFSKVISLITALLLGTTVLSLKAFAKETPPAKKPIVVVSLGDSYSSGEGNEPFFNQDLPIELKLRDLDWLAHRSEKSLPGKLNVGGLDGFTLDDYHIYKYDDSKPCNWFFVASSGAEIRHMSEELCEQYWEDMKKMNPDVKKEAWRIHGQRKNYCKKKENKFGDRIDDLSVEPYDSYRDLPYQLDVFKNNDLRKTQEVDGTGTQNYALCNYLLYSHNND